MNLYGYANGDPINFSDPFGLCPECPAVDPKSRDRGGVGAYGAPRPWKKSFHAGEDKLGTVGDPVFSPVSGTVVSSRGTLCPTCAGVRGQEMGNQVTISFKDADGGTSYVRLGHLGTVSVGSTVSAGEQVGTVGASGNAATAGPGGTVLPMTHVEYRSNSGAGWEGSIAPSSVKKPK